MSDNKSFPALSFVDSNGKEVVFGNYPYFLMELKVVKLCEPVYSIWEVIMRRRAKGNYRRKVSTR